MVGAGDVLLAELVTDDALDQPGFAPDFCKSLAEPNELELSCDFV